MYSPQELSDATGVAKNKIQKWIEDGSLVAYDMCSGKKTSRHKVRHDDWESFLAGRRVVPANGTARRTSTPRKEDGIVDYLQ